MNKQVVELLKVISDGDTIASAEIFESIVRKNINEKVCAKRKSVAKKAFSEENMSLIRSALKDKNVHVRMAAARHPNAKPEDLELALKDKHLHVKLAALSNPNLDKPDEVDPQVEKNNEVKKKIIQHLEKLK